MTYGRTGLATGNPDLSTLPAWAGQNSLRAMTTTSSISCLRPKKMNEWVWLPSLVDGSAITVCTVFKITKEWPTNARRSRVAELTDEPGDSAVLASFSTTSTTIYKSSRANARWWWWHVDIQKFSRDLQCIHQTPRAAKKIRASCYCVLLPARIPYRACKGRRLYEANSASLFMTMIDSLLLIVCLFWSAYLVLQYDHVASKWWTYLQTNCLREDEVKGGGLDTQPSCWCSYYLEKWWFSKRQFKQEASRVSDVRLRRRASLLHNI